VPRTSPAGLSLCADAGLLGGDHGRAVGPCPCRTYAPGDHWRHADQHRQPTRADAEWLAEAFTLWGIAVLIVIVTALTRDMTMRAWVYRAIAGLLLAIAALTAVTGSRTPVVWFKVCPVVLTASAALLLTASAA
jgi:hypothetical protein